MIVEFFGRPGAGKTTIARSLLPQNSKEGRFPRRAHGLVLVAGILKRSLRRPLIAIRVTRMVHATRQPTPHDRRVSIGALMTQVVRRDRPTLDILDQGSAQALWSVAFAGRTITKEVLDRMLAILPAPQILVHVRASDDAVRARLDHRSETVGLRSRAQAATREALEGSKRADDVVLEAIRQAVSSGIGNWGRTELVQVRSEQLGDVEDAVQRIRQAIASCKDVR